MSTSWPVTCIVLVGGQGTRLKHVLSDLPKPLAPINGVPFLDFLLMDLARQGITEVILATGYRSELIEARYGQAKFGLKIHYSVEHSPLGTGGAIRQAMSRVTTAQAIVLNGDSYCPLPLKDYLGLCREKGKPVNLALTFMADAGRYGLVHLNHQNEVEAFEEKKPGSSGFINVGIYGLDKVYFLQHTAPGPFSLEQDFLNRLPAAKQIAGFAFSDYFIDIGIPEDFERANRELPVPRPAEKIMWTLFLDRDGVINQYRPHDYVKNIREFKFRHGVLPALQLLAKKFDYIFMVTNQQGVSKGVMSEEDLERVHQHMLKKIYRHGGRIDQIFYCTSLLDAQDYRRKPNPGMLLQAQHLFPAVDFRHAIVVGDSVADIEMGKRLGLKTVCIHHAWSERKKIKALSPDETCRSLLAWARRC